MVTRASPNPPLLCPTTAVPASKQLKLSVLDGNRSFDLVNAKPARYHCTSQQAIASQHVVFFYARNGTSIVTSLFPTADGERPKLLLRSGSPITLNTKKDFV
ncbi:hypothetical protein SK128_011541 [Halocaridina rubra]|uniref:Uncharacterized protein n=1 Tax=Halocaridina rubra TaxID=373956 RepID=A0AAN9A318_HALRR